MKSDEQIQREKQEILEFRRRAEELSRQLKRIDDQC